MSALKKSQRILRSQSLIINFLSKPIRIGDIVQFDDGQHIIVGNIEEMIPDFSLDDTKIRKSESAEFKIAEEANVSLTIGANVNTPVAEGEIELKFGSKNSAFVLLKSIKRVTIPTNKVEEQLKELWKNKGYDQPNKRNKFFFINEVFESESGTIIFSQDKGNKVTITGKNNTPISSVSVLGEGKVEFVTNTKGTLEIISEKPMKPLFSALKIKGNGMFEIVK